MGNIMGGLMVVRREICSEYCGYEPDGPQSWPFPLSAGDES